MVGNFFEEAADCIFDELIFDILSIFSELEVMGAKLDPRKFVNAVQ